MLIARTECQNIRHGIRCGWCANAKCETILGEFVRANAATDLAVTVFGRRTVTMILPHTLPHGVGVEMLLPFVAGGK